MYSAERNRLTFDGDDAEREQRDSKKRGFQNRSAY
jgi:hypothetical protein